MLHGTVHTLQRRFALVLSLVDMRVLATLWLETHKPRSNRLAESTTEATNTVGRRDHFEESVPYIPQPEA